MSTIQVPVSAKIVDEAEFKKAQKELDNISKYADKAKASIDKLNDQKVKIEADLSDYYTELGKLESEYRRDRKTVAPEGMAQLDAQYESAFSALDAKYEKQLSNYDKVTEKLAQEKRDYDELTAKQGELTRLTEEYSQAQQRAAEQSNAVKDRISGIDAAMKENASQFSVATAGMDNWRNSQEGIIARNNYLNQQISLQREKISALTSQYQMLVSQGMSPSSAQAANLRTQINKETASLYSNEAELRRNVYAYRTAGTEGKRSGDKTRRSWGKAKVTLSGVGVGLATRLKGIGHQVDKLSRKVSKSITRGVGNLKRYMFGILGARGAFFLFRQVVMSYVNANDELQNKLNAIKYAFGEMIAPVIKKVFNLVEQGISIINTFVYALTGINLIARANANALNKVTDSTEKLTQAQKENQKQSAKFDVYSAFSENSSSSSNNGSGDGNAQTGFLDPNASPLVEELEKLLERLKKLFKEGNFYGAGEELANFVNKGIDALYNYDWDGLEKKIKAKIKAITDTFNGFVENVHWETLGQDVGKGINLIFTTALAFIDGIHWDSLGKALADYLNGLVKEINWKNIGKTIGDSIIAALDFAIAFVSNTDWKSVGEGLGNMVMGIDFYTIVKRLATLLIDVLKGAFAFMSGLLKTLKLGEIAKDILNGLVDAFIEAEENGELEEMFYNWAEAWWDGLEAALTLTFDIIDWLTDDLPKKFEEWVKTTTPEEVMQKIADIFWFFFKKHMELNFKISDFLKDLFTNENGEFEVPLILNPILWLGNKLWNNPNVKEWIKEKISTPFTNAWKSLGGLAVKIGAVFGYSYAKLKTWIKEKIFTPFVNAWKSLGGIAVKIGAKFSMTKDALKKKIAAWTSGAKNKVIEIGAKFKDMAKSGINSLIKSLNKLIEKLKVVSLAGWKPFGWMKTLPTLAQGGIVNNPGRGVPAVIGEAGAEAVLPLENNTAWMDTLADKISARIGGFNLYLDSRPIQSAIEKRQAQTRFMGGVI